LRCLDNQALDQDAAAKRDVALAALGQQVSLPSSQEQK